MTDVSQCHMSRDQWTWSLLQNMSNYNVSLLFSHEAVFTRDYWVATQLLEADTDTVTASKIYLQNDEIPLDDPASIGPYCRNNWAQTLMTEPLQISTMVRWFPTQHSYQEFFGWTQHNVCDDEYHKLLWNV